MAVNKVYRENPENNRERPVPVGTQPGTPLIINARPAVTLTARGDATVTETRADGSVVTYSNGGVGNLPDSATVAFDGTWEFAVAGATTTTANEVSVYITSAGALTLTVGTNTLYGLTDYPRDYAKVAGRAPVRIGA